LAFDHPLKGEKDFSRKRKPVVAVDTCKSFNESLTREKVCPLPFLVIFACVVRLPSLIHDV
jgi:hypothetical protein